MPKKPTRSRSSVSTHIALLLATHDSDALTLGLLLRSVEQQGFGLLLVIFTLPVLVPLPPGLGAIPGLMIILWSLQRLFGRLVPWVPQRLAKQPLGGSFLKLIKTRALPALDRLERIFGHTNSNYAPTEWEHKLACFVMVFMGFLIILPTPFLNTIPALIVMLIGLSFINQNRRLLWLSSLCGLLIFGAIYSGLSLGGDYILEELEDLQWK